ncbi:M4 family metallopeptidase [Hyalangium gracile]|uniref:M4 family metallopeptidase n=1 Tax=Hyalangium gracile TaxID=394092 RepID=UPI001CCC5D34|nr:M4 family metallopeptidase [Hyalangium gracile]
MSNKILKAFCAAWLGLTYAACGTAEQQQVDADELMTNAEAKDGTDIQQALSVLGNTRVLATQADKVTPAFIKGNLGQVSQGLVGVDAQAALPAVAAAFRMQAQDLVLKSTTTDSQGHTYLRYSQTKNGLQVVGAELLLMVNPKGTVYAANSSAYDVAPGVQVPTKPTIAPEAAAFAARGAGMLFRSESTGRLVYVHGDHGKLVLAYETIVTGERDGLPVRDMVYVNATNGQVALRAPTIHSAMNRAVHTANNGTSLPGTLKRSEGGAATGDSHVDDNYNHLGTTYQCYFQNFGRDSYTGTGAQLKSTVHYSSNYVNAFWNGTQMVYGDGDGVQSAPLGKSLDVTVHELTHAVTSSESNLTYSYESGALNEGMSDIFSAYCEAWTKGWVVDAAVWMIGDDVWTPATAGDALRYMGNPTQDGSSTDYYPERYTGSSDNGGVHWNSGIANLAFKLLSTGGTHPRNKTTVNVAGIGIQKAGKIFYEANANCMVASTNFAGAKTCTEQKAEQFYGAAEKASTTQAWEAVGVGIVVPPPTATPLSNGVALTGQSASTGANKYYKLTVPAGQTSLKFEMSGGTGDADLYTKFGAAPDASTYDCRPYASGNTETCTHNNPAAGDWYVMINAYSTFSGLSIKGTYSGTTPPTGDTLTNGVASAAYSGAKSTWTCWTLTVPSGKTKVVFNQAGGTGDADLYVRQGSAPTTSTYACRPYTAGNTETCTINSPAAGTWYACSYGYQAYSNTTMKGTY